MLQSRLASGTFEDPKNVIVFLRCGYFQKKSGYKIQSKPKNGLIALYRFLKNIPIGIKAIQFQPPK